LLSNYAPLFFSAFDGFVGDNVNPFALGMQSLSSDDIPKLISTGVFFAVLGRPGISDAPCRRITVLTESRLSTVSPFAGSGLLEASFALGKSGS